MKKILPFLFCMGSAAMMAAEPQLIRIGTQNVDLILQVAENGRVYQSYLGEKFKHEADIHNLPWSVHAATDGSVSTRGWEVYTGAGSEDYFEPALAITHNDGDISTYLYYVSSEQHAIPGGTETILKLRDNKYPVDVTLHYQAFTEQDVFKTWTEIKHQEKKPVTLSAYASAMIYFENSKYFLNEFTGDWANEMSMTSQQLQFGKKQVETKLGSRAAMHNQPFFEIGLGQPVQEHQGQVLMGSIGWTGNFRFTFEVDNVGNLRVLPGINPYLSAYELKPNEVFTTPEFVFTLSQNGTGQGSRNLQSWMRHYQLKNGMGSRMTLLNNWENTGFNFDEPILANLMKETKQLGTDLFLLDDGWFGNGENARNDDHAGLGDWEVNHSKLPGGVPALTKYAKDAGVKFGIWIEPEMINPRSELYKKHPDWVIENPQRTTYYYRNQLVLDLSNPEVQDYVFGVVDKIMQEAPEVAFFKWDCNSPITNVYSPYQKGHQQQLYIDHVRGVYNVFKRVSEKYPNLPIMMCSGGGARCDYEALKYFTEFWCSDDTDPVERCFIQWGFSQFMPAKAMCAHVTSWNKQTSVKFRTDVASMCKLGFDIGLHELSPNELTYCQAAIQNWKRLQPAIMDGEQYRLVSPYETNHMALNYVSADKKQAVLFAYDIHPRFAEKIMKVRLQGLDADKQYKVEEINLMPNTKSRLPENGKVYSGDYLMRVGISALTTGQTQSKVIEITAQ